jgi:integrase/recombinase XerD
MTNATDLIDAFCDQLWLQDGLATSSLASYRRDLNAWAAWLGTRGMLAADRGDVEGWLADQFRAKSKATSVARRLSTLRRFYRLQLERGTVREDPAARVRAPKRPRRLPKLLSESQVEALLAAPATESTLGLRDRAMLETLYATGLRVSELVGLRQTQVSLDMGVVRVMGKGSKERLVPLGDEAVEWLQRYFNEARPALAGQAKNESVFLTTRHTPLTRQAFWALIKRYAVKVRHCALGAVAPRVAARVRDASAESLALTCASCSCRWATRTSRPRRSTPVARERLKLLHAQHHPIEGSARVGVQLLE